MKCAATSKRSSSIQRGSVIPSGDASSRQRAHGTSCMRPAARSRSASIVGRARPSDGAANTALKPTCMGDCCVSRRRNEPSSADRRRVGAEAVVMRLLLVRPR